MSGLLKTQIQLGDSNTATQNFTLTSAAADGTMKLARGNFGATTQDVLTIDASGNVAIPLCPALAKSGANTDITSLAPGLTITGAGVSATYGAELTTNGTFTGNATGWTLGAGWAYSANNIVLTNTGGWGTVSQNVAVVSGLTYQVNWDQTNSVDGNAQITPSIGAVSGTKCAWSTTVTTNSQIITAGATGTLALTFAVTNITSTGTVTIDNVSVKLITPYAATSTIKYSAGDIYPTEIRSHWNGTNGSSICIGYKAGQNLTTGFYNTFSGMNAGYSNTTGYQNTFSGVNAGLSNTTGYQNTFSGVNAGYSNTTGYNNTFSGMNAGFSNTTGYNNTFSGSYAGYYNTTGYNNTFSGVNAGLSNTTGYYNTFSGVNAGLSNTTFLNCAAFGYNAQVGGSNQLRLGDTATTVYTQSGTVSASDERDKTDIRDTTLGLDFICKLRPVDYKWDIRLDYSSKAPDQPLESASEEEKAAYIVAKAEWLEANRPANLKHDGTHKRSRYHHGLIAQELGSLLSTTNTDFGGYQNFEVNGGEALQAVVYEELIGPMIKAIQELTVKNAALEARLLKAGI